MPCTFTHGVFVLPILPFSGNMYRVPRGAEVIAPRCFAMRRTQRNDRATVARRKWNQAQVATV
jgi:hypothetical protein